MKFLMKLLVTLFALASVVLGLIVLLQEEKESRYIGIYGEDSTY